MARSLLAARTALRAVYDGQLSELSAEHASALRGNVDDHAHGYEAEIDEHDLGARFNPAESGPVCRTGDSGFGNRGIDHSAGKLLV